MKTRSIVFAGVVAGAVALALAGCTRTAEIGDGQGYRGGRGAAAPAAAGVEETVGRGGGRGRQAFSQETLPPADFRRAFDRPLERRENVDPASERTGREVAETGELASLEGTLVDVDGEWYLESAEGRYLLHLGNTAYVERTGIDLQAGETVAVRGLADGDEVSVVSMVADGNTYAFRNEDGTPLWAGNGRGSAGGGRTGISPAGPGTGQGAGQGAGRGGLGGGRGRITRTDV